MRVHLVLLVIALLPGCTVNLVRKSAATEALKQRIDYFKWLYEKGFYHSDPEMMKRAASKLLEVSGRSEEEPSSHTEALEHLMRRLEDEIDRLRKEKQ